jgi:hypothetical protein
MPAIAMVLLSAIVWIRMYFERVGEIRRRRINPQTLATSASKGEALEKVQAADNFSNLFEIPVLFYALCAILGSTGGVSAFYVAGAWLFVALRYAHSLIHLTYNRVMHRFMVYLISTALLFVLWGVFAVQILLTRTVA